MSKAEFLMIRAGWCLKPYGQVAEEMFEHVKGSKPVLVTVHQARNPDHHRKFWELAAKVSDFDPHFVDAEDAVRWVKRQIPGMHRRYKEKDGTLVIELKSINFASMDQVKFSRFYARAIYCWSKRIKTDPELLLAQVAA